jgi:hypothetical protein
MKKLKKKTLAKSKIKKAQQSNIHNTEGAEMPDPAAHPGSPQKDVRFAFRRG